MKEKLTKKVEEYLRKQKGWLTVEQIKKELKVDAEKLKNALNSLTKRKQSNKVVVKMVKVFKLMKL